MIQSHSTSSPTLLVLDIGNTNIKWGTASSDNQVLILGRSASIDEVMARLNELPDRPSHMAIGRSGSLSYLHQILDFASTVGIDGHVVEAKLTPDIKSLYAPGEAGADRLANVIAASKLFSPPVVIVDAGSAITTEVIGINGDFLGGSIMPGFSLLAKSLHKGTADLPQVDFTSAPAAIGSTTRAAIHAGIYYGALGAVRSVLTETLKALQVTDAPVIITGGDSKNLINGLEGFQVHHIPGLTLTGIAQMARHQFPHLR